MRRYRLVGALVAALLAATAAPASAAVPAGFVDELVARVPAPTALAFTPDGNALATGAINGDIQFWDPKTGEQATLLRTGYDRVFALAFSPNGEILAVGSRDTTVRLLRLPSN